MGFVLEQIGMEVSDESRTRCGRCHDIVEILEHLIVFAGERDGHILKSGIGHRLSTACLFLGISHIETKMCEQFVGCHAGFGIKGIDIARNK